MVYSVFYLSLLKTKKECKSCKYQMFDLSSCTVMMLCAVRNMYEINYTTFHFTMCVLVVFMCVPVMF